jgi:hypothetical protein
VPHLYLQAKDYALYSVPEGIDAGDVIRATILIDAYLRRPEGLLSSDGLVMDATSAPIRETYLTPARWQVVLTRTPVVAIRSVEVTNHFGQTAWREVDFSAGFVDEDSGLYALPPTVPYGTRVRVSYVAGWDYATLPGDVKLACATLLGQRDEMEGLSSNIKKAEVGDASFERFAPGAFDTELRALLQRYRRVIA